MLSIDDSADGAIVAVRAQPGAKRNALIGVHAGMLRVAVAQPPERGRANDAIVALLASEFGCKRNQVAIVSGETSLRKRVLFRGISKADLQSRLDRVLLDK